MNSHSNKLPQQPPTTSTSTRTTMIQQRPELQFSPCFVECFRANSVCDWQRFDPGLRHFRSARFLVFWHSLPLFADGVSWSCDRSFAPVLTSCGPLCGFGGCAGAVVFWATFCSVACGPWKRKRGFMYECDVCCKRFCVKMASNALVCNMFRADIDREHS